MSGTTSVPPVQITPQGVVVPTEPAILAGVQADINAAMGGALSAGLSTPQGQLATTEAAVIGDANSQLLALANSFDPAYAQGRFQDGLGRIYFITRQAATATVVQATLVGAQGTVIPVGTQAQAQDGTVYAATSAGTISSTGTLTLPFAATVTGPISCPINALSQPVTQISGWNTITNAAAGAIGTNAEARGAFETRRSASVAANAQNVNGAILGAVLNVPGVTDGFVTDNSATTTTTVGGVALNPNSLYVCVAGNYSNAAVGRAIISKKPPGCGYTGNTTVTVQDTNPLFASPPSYSVTFQAASQTNIYFAVSIPNTTLVPSNAALLVQSAILNAFAGGDGKPRARIGTVIYASRYSDVIDGLGPWAQTISVFVGTSASPTSTTTTLSINQQPVTASSNITLTLV